MFRKYFMPSFVQSLALAFGHASFAVSFAQPASAGVAVYADRSLFEAVLRPGYCLGHKRMMSFSVMAETVTVTPLLLILNPPMTSMVNSPATRRQDQSPEVGAFYWTVPAPDIVNLWREEQGLVSV